MNSNRIKVTLYNRTFKEIDMSDFTRITEGLFSNRDDIVAVSFPEGVETIASNAFENCRRLEKVEFPDSLKSYRISYSGLTMRWCCIRGLAKDFRNSAQKRGR